ncbi:DNA topoisomerase 1-like isoform X2 [Varroa destructor]|uniref:DNA topoisomerase I n=1 Tax=Varroa destructor TaxID=109461 RepID=A0A7M7L0M1_VARDE|nr:DNA topoisomerase 1-like isoform X2 [Varroa destructor]
MTSADVDVGQTVGEASTEAVTDKKENGHINGSIENGDAHKNDEKRHSSSGHRDSSAKDKDHQRSKDKHSSSSKDKDKHRSSSSHHSSSKDKDRHRSDKDKDRHRLDKEKDRHRSDRDKERADKDKDRHRDKHRSSDKDKHRSDKDKDRDKDKHRSSDKDKEKDKHRSSDGKDKDKERKSHSSSSKDKDRDREKDKDRHSTSSKSKDKDRHSSSSSHHKDKHSSSHHRSEKDREKDRHHSSSHRDREKDQERRERKGREKREKEEADRMKNGGPPPNNNNGSGSDARFDDEYSMELGSTLANGLEPDMAVKTEPDSPMRCEQPMPRMTMTLVSETVKEEDKDESMEQQDEDDDDDADEADSGADEGKLTLKEEEGSEPEDAEKDAQEDDSDNEPLAAKLARVRQTKIEASQESADESDDEPLSKKLSRVKKAQAAKSRTGKKRKHSHGTDDSDSDHGDDDDDDDCKMDVDGNDTSDDDDDGGDDDDDAEAGVNVGNEHNGGDDRMKGAKSSRLAFKVEPIENSATTGSSSDNNEDSQSEDSDEEPLAKTLERARKRARLEDQSISQETGYGSTSDSDEPLSKKLERYKAKSKMKAHKNKFKTASDDDDWGAGGDSDDSGAMKKRKKTAKTKASTRTPVKKGARPSTDAEAVSPKKRKADEEEEDVWKWWEEDKKPEGVKWNTLEHKGPVFAPDYEPLPDNVPFFYNGKRIKLSLEAEEIATFYARMLDHDYTQKEAFNKNFFHDWRKFMTAQEKETISDLKKCDFSKMASYFKELSELRKNRTKDEKLEEKKKNEAQIKEYGFCIIDGHKQKIGNFKIEPPGLFRGRGEHPKMGKLKTRTQPEDVIINIGKDAPIPPPPKGHRWKEVRHDNTVTWLCCWTENIAGSNKYIMLNPSSKLKGEKDFQKYETARRLKSCVKSIRDNYQADWKSKEMRIRQRAVALYFIDKLALRAGNEKDSDEQADTVGCCSLRVEHIRLHDELDGKENVVEFDFLGKDSIRYQNAVPVEKRVYKNVKLFCEGKKPGDDLFDRLNTTILNKHLNELMEGLTAKVFRTYNASKTLQEQLEQLTDPDMSIAEKMLAYNRANRAVAVLCNHQRAVPKTFEKSMENLQKKIDEKEDQIIEAKREYREAKKHADKATAEKKHKRLLTLEDQLKKLQVQATDREENKQIALGTSKLNYLDPRISVAWCKKWGVPIEKVYNKTQRDKFRWAIEMVEGDYKF